MTTITFNDDSIHLHKHSIAIRFKTPDAADAGESKSTPDNLAIDMIDKMVAKINEINKDIISKYDYNIVKEGEEFEVCILWNPIFKNFNEPQRFCYLKFLYVKEKKFYSSTTLIHVNFLSVFLQMPSKFLSKMGQLISLLKRCNKIMIVIMLIMPMTNLPN